MKNIIITMAAFLFFASAAFAQGSIEGRVTDANGNPVGNVTLTAVDSEKKAVGEATTDEDGTYSFQDLTAGKYTIIARVPNGFRPAFHEITVEDDETATADLILMAAGSPAKPAPASRPDASPAPTGYVPQLAELIARFDSPQLSSGAPRPLWELAAQFEKLGDSQRTEWLRYYYAALALASYGWQHNPDPDNNAAKGIALLNKAEAIGKGNSEIYIVRAMFAQQQMLVDPQSRWMSYGQKAVEALETAKKLDPNNPRVYYMFGLSLFGTPEQFGGGKAKAKPYFENAARKFEAFKPESPLSPNWGRQANLNMLDTASH